MILITSEVSMCEWLCGLGQSNAGREVVGVKLRDMEQSSPSVCV